MALPIRYSTASQTIIIGPFLDDTDGKTAETALTIANTDIKLAKNNAISFSNKNSGGATHIANGYYYCTLDATDTDTLGRLVITVNMTGALPVWHEFEVISAQEFDAFYGSSYAQVDVRQISGSAVSTTTAQLGVNVVNVAGTAQTARDLGAQLDATISSRAPASTALSNTTWTDTKAGYLDAAISSRSTLTAADVWSYTTRTLSSFGTLIADIWSYSTRTLSAFSTSLAVAVWDVLESAIATASSIGMKLKTNLDTTVSSRANGSDYTSARAAKLDNLDATISSRAAAATALSNTTWTAARAGYLDNLSGGAVALNADVQTLLTRIIGTLAAGTHQPQSGDAYAVVTNAAYGNEQIKGFVDDLESRLTATRAGYLDNLGGGAVALHTDMQTLLSRVVGTLAAGTHQPQSGDVYAVATNGTYGNSAIKSAIDTVDSVVDLIEDIVRNRIEVTDSTGTVTLYEDNSTTVKFSVANCLTDDSVKTTRKRLE